MKYLYGLLLTLIVIGGIFVYLLMVPKNQNLRGLAFPNATQEATTTGWADDGSIIRLDNSGDTVGIGSTTPSEKLGIAGSLFAQETSGTTTLNAGSTGTGVGSCFQMRGTDGVVYRMYPTATTSNTGRLVIEVGSCQ